MAKLDGVEINQLCFGLWSANDIVRYGIEITSAKGSDGRGQIGVNDERLGIVSNGVQCPTCGLDRKNCPGHFGYIKLATPILHPLLFAQKMVVYILNLFCHHCSRSLVDEANVRSRKLDLVDGGVRYLRMLKIAEKINLCSRCKSPHFKSTMDEGQIYEICPNTNKKAGGRSFQKVLMDTTTINSMLEKIPDEDVQLLGLCPDTSHPKNLILTVLPILPLPDRPETVAIGLDRTLQYQEIVKHNLAVRNEKDENIRHEIINRLVFAVNSMFDNSKKRGGKSVATYHTGRAKIGIAEFLSGKRGAFRGNMMGNRTF